MKANPTRLNSSGSVVELPTPGSPLPTNSILTKSPPRPDHHGDWTAVAMSALPGLGHFYKGYYLEGALMLLLDVALFALIGAAFCLAYVLTALLATVGVAHLHWDSWMGVLNHPSVILFGILIPLLFWVTSAIDAYKEADVRHTPSTGGAKDRPNVS